jgi:hypothetical protein
MRSITFLVKPYSHFVFNIILENNFWKVIKLNSLFDFKAYEFVIILGKFGW